MQSRLAEVVDKTVIVEVDTELSLCSCESDVVGETCSLGGNDTRRDSNNDAACGKMKNLALKTTTSLWLKSNKFDLGRKLAKNPANFCPIFWADFIDASARLTACTGVKIRFGQDLEKKSRKMRKGGEEKMADEQHPSYGMLQLTRSSLGGNGTALFGSSIMHNDVIRLTITNGYMEQEDGQNRYYAKTGRRNCIVEVDMSYTQFAEVITSLNMGDGVPVTIMNIGGQPVPRCPYETMFLY